MWVFEANFTLNSAAPHPYIIRAYSIEWSDTVISVAEPRVLWTFLKVVVWTLSWTKSVVPSEANPFGLRGIVLKHRPLFVGKRSEKDHNLGA
jgi:hypothetical protein